MITIWKQVSENEWQLVEELQDDLALAQRLADLQDGVYKAEKKIDGVWVEVGGNL